MVMEYSQVLKVGTGDIGEPGVTGVVRRDEVLGYEGERGKGLTW